MHGIDISNWQNGLQVKNLDIDFCICKLTEGVGYVDPTSENFVNQCVDENLLWGFYHFARENSPEDEADWFVTASRDYFGNGIPVLDYETQNENNVEWCERFMSRVYAHTGVWPILYVSASRCGEYENSWLPEKCGLWVAGYPWANPNWTDEKMPYSVYPWKFAAIWQFTSDLQLDGYSGRLDGDIAYMDDLAWHKYANPDYENMHTDYSEPQITKSVDDLVLETLLGEYGDGDNRKRMLGDMYESVQNRINELYSIADEVIEGKWGDGWNRENALNGAGYPYSIVQRIVNEKLA